MSFYQTIKNTCDYYITKCCIVVIVLIENPITGWILVLFNIWLIQYLLNLKKPITN